MEPRTGIFKRETSNHDHFKERERDDLHEEVIPEIKIAEPDDQVDGNSEDSILTFGCPKYKKVSGSESKN